MKNSGKRNTLLTFTLVSAVVQQQGTGRHLYAEGETATATNIWCDVKHLSSAQQQYRGLQGISSPIEIVMLTEDLTPLNGEYVITIGTKTYKPTAVRQLDNLNRETEIIAQLQS
jgi:hypothetical protein